MADGTGAMAVKRRVMVSGDQLTDASKASTRMDVPTSKSRSTPQELADLDG